LHKIGAILCNANPSPLEHLRAGIRLTGLVALFPGFPAVDRVAKWAVLA
jgi:hypothetical protein